MLAYNKTSLRNLVIQEEVAEAVHCQLLSPEKENEVTLHYPVDLYTPNLFVRIGLGILTIFIVLASVGLLALITNFHNAGAILFLLGAACYGSLEFMVSGKKHYNSGVDNILMMATIILFTSAIMEFLPSSVNGEVSVSLLVFFSSFYLTIRFADTIMGVVTAVASLLWLFYFVSTFGIVAQQIVPFIIMAASGLLYFVVQKIAGYKSSFYYQFLLKAIAVVALCILYLAGNYYVVREISIEMFRFNLNKNGVISLGLFYWLWTMAVPVVYIVAGLLKKDLVFTRLGIIFSVIAVMTFRYYHAILSAEAAMLIAGTLIVLVTYGLIQYLRQPRYRFTFKAANTKNENILNVEGLIIGEAFGNNPSVQHAGTKFGGGSFGGAGAGDSY